MGYCVCIVYIGLGLTGAIICFCCSINDVSLLVLYSSSVNASVNAIRHLTSSMCFAVIPKEYHGLLFLPKYSQCLTKTPRIPPTRTCSPRLYRSLSIRIR